MLLYSKMITVCHLVPVTIEEELDTLGNIFSLIFDKFLAWNWGALTYLKKQSPFLCLDDFQNSEVSSNRAKKKFDSSDTQSETSWKDYCNQSERFM